MHKPCEKRPELKELVGSRLVQMGGVRQGWREQWPEDGAAATDYFVRSGVSEPTAEDHRDERAGQIIHDMPEVAGA